MPYIETHLAVQTIETEDAKVTLFIQHIDNTDDSRGIETTCCYDIASNSILNVRSSTSKLEKMTPGERVMLALELANEGVTAAMRQIYTTNEGEDRNLPPYFYGDDCGMSIFTNGTPLPKREMVYMSAWD